MMHFMRKAKGSISIFLCLILLPMVTYSTMIIDASRLQAARSVVATAGDLTMNAVMSEYEQILEDMYGLFAVAQSEKDLKQALEAYFKQTIEGQLISGENRDDYVDELSKEILDLIFEPDQTPEKELTNFLEMQIAEDGFHYEPVAGSALANPAVMKRQIIEYMKYKGPVSLFSTLFSKLEFLKNSSKQTDALDKKVKYTQKLGAMEEPCQRAYKAIDVKLVIEGEPDEEFGYNDGAMELYPLFSHPNKNQEFDKMFDEIRENYKYMTAFRILDESFPFTSAVTRDSLRAHSAYTSGKKDYSSVKNMSEETVEDLEEKLKTLIQKRNEILDPDYYEGSFEKYFDAFLITSDKDEDDEDQDFRELNYEAVFTERTPDSNAYFPSLQRIKDGGTWTTILDAKYNSSSNAATAYSEAKKKFDLQMEISTSGLDELAMFILYCDQYDELTAAIDTTFTNYHTAMRKSFLEDNDAADKGFDSALEELWDAFILDDEQSTYHWLYGATKETDLANEALHDEYDALFDSFISKLSNGSMYDSYAFYYADQAFAPLGGLYLTLMIMDIRLGEAKKALEDLLNVIAEAEKAKEEWRKSIGKVDSSSTKTSMMSDFDTTTDGLSKEDVQELLDKIKEIIPLVQKMMEDIKTVQYLDTKVVRPQSLKDAIYETDELTKTQKLAITVLGGSELESEPKWPMVPTFENNAIIKQYLIAAGGSTDNVLQTAEELVNTKFDKSGMIYDDFVPVAILDSDIKFIVTLYNICNPAGKNKLDSDTQGEYDTIKNEADQEEPKKSEDDSEESEEEQKPPKKSEALESNGPKEVAKSNPVKGDIIGGFLDAIKGYPTSYNDQSNTNDSPDADEYKTNNVNIPEGKDAAKNADPGSSLTKSTSLLERLANIGKGAVETAYLEEYFTEMFTCRTDALEGVNVVMLNGYSTNGAKKLNQNTEWYGKEIEYIIWGDPNLQNNLTKNDVMIYTIRFALNAIYAFTAADIQSFALEVATAIAGWTVIGVPIVQACITIAIALAESAWDLKLLHQGKDVPIYKNAQSFVCSPAGFLKEIAKEVTTEVVKEATEYAITTLEETLDNAIDGLKVEADKKISDYADSMTQYVNDYIDEQSAAVLSSIESQFVTPLINKITPVMLQVRSSNDNVKDAVNQAIEDAYAIIENNIDGMNDGIVKELSKTFLNDYARSKKQELSGKLESYFQTINEQTDPPSIKEILIGDSSPTNNGVIGQWIMMFSNPVKERLEDVKQGMVDRLKAETEKGAGNLKSFMHEQMDTAAGEITGKVSEKVTGIVDQYATDVVTDGIDTSASSGGFSLNYKEYCKIFVLLNVATDETKMLQRAAALIQANVRNASSSPNGSFEMVKAYTLVSINADIRMGTLFPWTVSDEQNEAMGDSELKFDFSHLGSNYITMNYSGFNGY